jgi:hypothetical protein
MCYNASNSHAIKELERIANRPIWDQVKIRWEPQAHVSAFARPWWPVISTEHPGYIDMKQWGLLPPYAREDPKEFLAKICAGVNPRRKKEARTVIGAGFCGNEVVRPTGTTMRWWCTWCSS